MAQYSYQDTYQENTSVIAFVHLCFFLEIWSLIFALHPISPLLQFMFIMLNGLIRILIPEELGILNLKMKYTKHTHPFVSTEKNGDCISILIVSLIYAKYLRFHSKGQIKLCGNLECLDHNLYTYVCRDNLG